MQTALTFKTDARRFDIIWGNTLKYRGKLASSARRAALDNYADLAFDAVQRVRFGVSKEERTTLDALFICAVENARRAKPEGVDNGMLDWQGFNDKTYELQNIIYGKEVFFGKRGVEREVETEDGETIRSELWLDWAVSCICERTCAHFFIRADVRDDYRKTGIACITVKRTGDQVYLDMARYAATIYLEWNKIVDAAFRL